jgi:hypothetical protein
MAILSFELDQLFALLVPGVVGAFAFPSKPNFVQQILSTLQNQSTCMNAPLVANPL